MCSPVVIPFFPFGDTTMFMNSLVVKAIRGFSFNLFPATMPGRKAKKETVYGADPHTSPSEGDALTMATARRDASAEWQEFDYDYRDIECAIRFNPEWNNGTGYFNGLLLDPKVIALGNATVVSMCPVTFRRLIIKVVGGEVSAQFERRNLGENGTIAFQE
jgi:hypothetical protein